MTTATDDACAPEGGMVCTCGRALVPGQCHICGPLVAGGEGRDEQSLVNDSIEFGLAIGFAIGVLIGAAAVGVLWKVWA